MSVGEAKSTLECRSALHLFRLGEAMLRIVRNKNRPLLHMMRAWSVVAPHLVEVVEPIRINMAHLIPADREGLKTCR